jgi:hypothetical protein
MIFAVDGSGTIVIPNGRFLEYPVSDDEV